VSKNRLACDTVPVSGAIDFLQVITRKELEGYREATGNAFVHVPKFVWFSVTNTADGPSITSAAVGERYFTPMPDRLRCRS
jgi:hypothetical protein